MLPGVGRSPRIDEEDACRAGRTDNRWRGCEGIWFAGVMGIERFEAAGDARRVAACYEIFHATRVADDPDVPVMPRRVFEGWLKTGWVGDPRETWLVADEDGVAGWYLLELPFRDNKHLGSLDVMVRPDRQRRGLGTALLRHAAGRALTDGRSLLTGYACGGSAGEAFARSFGATGGLAEIHRVLDLDTVAAGHLAELRAEAQRAAAGYSLISWMSPAPGAAGGGRAAGAAVVHHEHQDQRAHDRHQRDARLPGARQARPVLGAADRRRARESPAVAVQSSTVVAVQS